MTSAASSSVHGGPDALGAAAHDLSTNGNACGPCPQALAALRAADFRHYPDPAYTALRRRLAAWHRVDPERIVIGASASELIQRLTAATALQAHAAGKIPTTVWILAPSYGDYARAAQAYGLALAASPESAHLLWACEPSSPRGGPADGLASCASRLHAGQTLVLDQAYEPLRLSGPPSLTSAEQDNVWRLHTPNKALGLTGVRAAYALTPASGADALRSRMQSLAPSWPLGAAGVALLHCWTRAAVQDWLEQARATLRIWKTRQIHVLQALGWQVRGSDANFFTAAHAAWPVPGVPAALRRRGFKLRDCTSFGLPGTVRVAVAAPQAQDALATAWQDALAECTR